MNPLKKAKHRFRALFQKRELDSEMDEELRAHIELRTQQNIEAGMSREEARYAALRQFGWVESIKESCREERGVRWIEDLVQDIKFGGRMLRKNRGFATIAVLTLALGIGANTAMFSLVNAVFLRPMAAVKPQEIVSISARTGPNGGPEGTSFLEYRDLGERSADVLSGLAAMSGVPTAVALDAKRTKRVWASVVSGNYFSLLGTLPLLGRTFLPEEGDPLAGGNSVVLSEKIWRREFGGDTNVIGKAVRVNELTCTVVGVIPESAAVVERAFDIDVFIPISMFAHLKGGKGQLEDRHYRSFDLIGRLRPGATVEKAQAKFNVLAAQFQQEYPPDWASEREGRSVSRVLRVIPESQSRIPAIFGSAGIISYLAILAGVVGMVLVIACANLANLLLARATARRKEIAVRLAIGAGRGRLIRQLVSENILLSVLGGIGGLLLALWATRVLVAWNPVNRFDLRLPPIELDLAIDFRVVAFTFALSLITAVLFGLAPAWQSARTDLVSSLKDRSGDNFQSRRVFRLRNLLIIGQVAVSLILVSGAGLLLHGVLRAQKVDLGFDRRNLALLTLALDQRDEPPAKTEAVTKELLARVRGLPGVQNADFAFWVPLGLGQMNLETKLDGYTPGPNEHVAPEMNLVGPRFFDTLRVPLVSGRTFSSGDAAATEVVINEAMAKRYWPGERPIGRRLQNIFGSFEIVGIAKTMKYAGFTEPPTPMFFLPAATWFKKTTPPTLALLVRTRTSPQSMLDTLRREVTSFAPNVPIIDAKTMDDHLALRAFPTRLAAIITGAFGVLALILAAIGLYGVMAYFVGQRTREFGIRMALGANRRDILGLVTGHGLLLVGLGALAGLAGAFATSRFLSSLLFGLRSTDPVTFLAVTILLTGVALLACYVPARRAAKVNPMVALRYE